MISIVNKTVFTNPTHLTSGVVTLVTPAAIGNTLVAVISIFGNRTTSPNFTTDQGEIIGTGDGASNLPGGVTTNSAFIYISDVPLTKIATSINFASFGGGGGTWPTMIVYEISGNALTFFGHSHITCGSFPTTSFTANGPVVAPVTNSIWFLAALTTTTVSSSSPTPTETDTIPDTGSGCHVSCGIFINVVGAQTITYNLSSSGDICVPVGILSEPPILGEILERSFACNGCFESTSAYGDVLKSLALSMAGFVVPPGDCWRIYAGSYVPPEVTLEDADCRSSIKGDFRLSARDTCNGVKGQYIPAFLPINPLGPLASSPASPAWKKTDFPPVQRATYIAEDGGIILWKDIQLDFTISLWMAQRIARIVLERLRRQVTISLPAKLTGLALLAADTMNFIHDRWNSITPPVPTVFQISHTALRMEQQADAVPSFGVDLLLRQTDANVYEFEPPSSSTDFGDYSSYGQTGIGAGNVE